MEFTFLFLNIELILQQLSKNLFDMVEVCFFTWGVDQDDIIDNTLENC